MGDTSETLTVDWATSDGTALAGDDYVTGGGQVTFEPGQTEQPVTVAVTGDTLEEAHETFFVDFTLSGGAATVVADRAVGTILNDETTISINDDTVTEGDDATRLIDLFFPESNGSLATDSDGELYVTTAAPGTILRYDRPTDSFVPFAADNLLVCPYIRFGPDGNPYVADKKTRRVFRFDGNTGAFIDIFVSQGDGGLYGPCGLDFGADGNLYGSSENTDNVLRYNETFLVSLSNATGGATLADDSGEGLILDPTTYDSTDVPKSLKDAKNPARPGMTRSTLEVGGSGKVYDLNVELDTAWSMTVTPPTEGAAASSQSAAAVYVALLAWAELDLSDDDDTEPGRRRDALRSILTNRFSQVNARPAGLALPVQRGRS